MPALAYTLDSAATALAGVISRTDLEDAILHRRRQDGTYWPILRTKQGTRKRHIILHTDLQDWLAALPDHE